MSRSEKVTVEFDHHTLSLMNELKQTLEGRRYNDSLSSYIRGELKKINFPETLIEDIIDVVRAYHKVAVVYPQNEDIIRGLLTVLFRGEKLPEAWIEGIDFNE